MVDNKPAFGNFGHTVDTGVAVTASDTTSLGTIPLD